MWLKQPLYDKKKTNNRQQSKTKTEAVSEKILKFYSFINNFKKIED